MILTTQSASQSQRVNRGRRVEDIVERVHELRDFREHALLYRCHPGVRAGRIVSPQGPDFSGFLVASGRHVFVEVKALTEGPLDLPRPGLTPKGRQRLGHFTWAEVERLRACSDAGGLAVVLVLHGVAAASWCVLLWDEIGDWIHEERRSVPVAQLLERRTALTTLYLRDAERRDP